MKEFMGKTFQLSNPTAYMLYEEYAKNMPIIDYHCHLVPKDIWEDRKFKDLTEVWLVDGHYGDHYKWRLMRARGASEDYITGDRTNLEKYLKFAETIPYAIGNPIYHWVHLELRKYFGITKTLSSETALEIWEECNKKLETLTARKMIELNKVEVLCTTDDPIDSLEYHLKLKNDASFKTKVLPTFRPDKAINVDKADFAEYIEKLGSVAGISIHSMDDLERALVKRMDFFYEVGCRVTDHALDDLLYIPTTINEANHTLLKALNKEELSVSEIAKFKSYLLVFLGKEYHKRGWAQQYHINTIRNNSSRMMRILGADTGFDSINDCNFAPSLSKLLDTLDSTDQLPKTVVYSLNPKDNESLATICNCFNKPGIKNRIQYGSAWWFNDQLDGMRRQMTALANMGMIANFVGMLTDSRSFLSYPRHDYFRRLLCSYFGELIENGDYPANISFVGQIVQDICYNNAKEFFFKEEK